METEKQFTKAKQFSIVYDEKQKKYAVTLNTLVSEIEDLKSLDSEIKKFESQKFPTSNDFIVHIGDKSTKTLREFKDMYSEYGIHVGYRGTKAWIYCNKIKWNRASYSAFHAKLMDLYLNIGMNPESVKEKILDGINELKSNGKTIVPDCLTTCQEMLWSTIVEVGLIAKMKNTIRRFLFRVFRAESKRIHQQYCFAILLFYKKYMHSYIKLEKKPLDNSK